MVQFKIAVIVGSLRKDSINKKLALALAKLVPADFYSSRCALMTCRFITKMMTRNHLSQSSV